MFILADYYTELLYRKLFFRVNKNWKRALCNISIMIGIVYNIVRSMMICNKIVRIIINTMEFIFKLPRNLIDTSGINYIQSAGLITAHHILLFHISNFVF